MPLVRALGAAWAASLGLGEVDAYVPPLDADVTAWLGTIAAATDFETAELIAKAGSERTSTVTRWLLDRTRSCLASASGPINWDEIGAHGQMLLRIVELVGPGTDFPRGQLAKAHARLLMGLGGQLRRWTAQDDYLQAERQYLGHHDAALAALARLGAAASDPIRVAITGSPGLQPDFSSLTTAAEQARAAAGIDLTPELDGFERTLRCIAAIRAGAPGQANCEPARFAGDPEAAQLFETAAFANLDNLPAGLRLAQLATDVYGLQGVTVNVVAAVGRALVQQRRWPDAVTVLGECHRQDPRDPDIAGPLAEAYQELGQPDSARTMLVGMLRNPPTTQDLWALQSLQNLAFLRNDPEFEHWQGLIAQLDPARTLAGQIPAPASAPQANPEPILAVFHDGSLSIDRRLLDLPEQERTAHMTAAIVAGSPDGAQQLSDLMTSDPALARRVAQLLGVTLLSARQQRAAAHIDAGEAHFQARDFAAASAEYAAALEEDPDNAQALLFLGDVNYGQGQYDLAQAYFEESIAIAPDPQAYRFLGDSIVQAGGSKDHGRLCYREALRMAPGYGGARVALQQLDEADDQGGGPSGAVSPPTPVVIQPEPEAEQVVAPAALRWSPARVPVRRQPSRQAMQMFADVDDTAASAVPSAQASSPGAALPRDDLLKVTPAPPRLPDEAPADGFADRLVRQVIDIHGPDSFVAVIDDDEAFGRWLAAASPDVIAAAVMEASMIAYHYEVKDRNLPRWQHWTRRQVQLAEALPPGYGPSSSSMGLGRHRLLALANSGWADVLYSQGHLAEARDWYERAIGLMDAEREARERDGLLGEAEYDQVFSSTDPQAAVLVRLASTCRDLGDPAAADGYQAQAWELDRKRPTSETHVDQFIGAGDYAEANGDMNDALSFFHQAWVLAEQLAATAVVPRALAKTLNALGRCHHRLRLHHSALAYFERTRQLNEAVGNAERLTWDYREIARIYRDRPDLGDARLAFESSLRNASCTSDPGSPFSWAASNGTWHQITAADRAWDTLLELGSLLEDRGDLAAAASFLGLATSVADVARSSAVDDAQRVAVANQRIAAFAALTRIGIRRATAEPPDPAAADDAWLASEAMRARSFLDALGDDELMMPPGIPAAIAAQEASALERRRRLASAGGGGAKFWLDLDAIQQELEALWSSMVAITPATQQYVDVRRSRPATASDIQRLIAADDRATVIASVTSHGPDGLAVIAVRSDSPRPLVISQPADLARLSRFVLENLGSAGRVRELATDLEDLFHYEMQPLSRALAEVSSPGEILVVSPFAALNYVPLAALRIADVPLVERNPLAVLPNASLTRALRAAAGSQPHRPAAVFGDPTDNLPGARSEAELVARLLGTDAICGSMATREAVSEALTEAGVAHIAAHAHFDSANPLDSGIKLADGLLSARDLITRSFRSLSLVTLSACETGISQDNPAQELLGLTRALLFAGADSLLVSLWKVPDTSTVDIMSAFYRGLKAKMGKAVALQAAILAARDKSAAERFDKWAGFELIGEWR